MEKNNINTSIYDKFEIIRDSFYITEKVHERYLLFMDIAKLAFRELRSETNDGILNYTDFDFYIQHQERPDNYRKLLAKLEEIRSLLYFENQKNHDVIQWLAYLYYFEEMSVPAISKILQGIGIEWKSQALSHFLGNTLGWTMRKNTHITKGGVSALSYISALRKRVGGVFAEEK